MPPSVSDKALHGLAYFGLALLVLRALGGGVSARLTWSQAVAAVSITIGYGATDELHQLFVPGRSADTRDLLADAAGAVTAPVVWWAILGNLRSRIPHSKSQD